MRSWQQPRLIVLVFAGGCLGTLLRAGVGWVLPASGWATTLAVNVIGSFVLGWLTAVVTRRPTEAMARLRLFAGTGLCGAFTTYSAFAAIGYGWIAAGRIGWAIGYAVVSLLLGVVATWCGFEVGQR